MNSQDSTNESKDCTPPRTKTNVLYKPIHSATNTKLKTCHYTERTTIKLTTSIILKMIRNAPSNRIGNAFGMSLGEAPFAIILAMLRKILTTSELSLKAIEILVTVPRNLYQITDLLKMWSFGRSNSQPIELCYICIIAYPVHSCRFLTRIYSVHIFCPFYFSLKRA